MKKFITLSFIVFLYQNTCIGIDYGNKYEQERSLAVNKARNDNYQMSDAELIKFLEEMFKYLPEELAKIKNSAPLEQKNVLNNIREFYIVVGISIPELIRSFEKSPELKEFYARLWMNDTLGVQYAESILLNLSNIEYQTILDQCVDLINAWEKPKNRPYYQIIKENIPMQLNFIKIEFINIQEVSCEIYLYKGIGSIKSIGYDVKKDENNIWKLYSFNYFENYDKHLIEIKEYSH